MNLQDIADHPLLDHLSELYIQATLKLAKGNLGAVSALNDCYVKELKNDAAVQSLLFLALFTLDIKGADIWIIYKDECGRDPAKFISSVIDKLKKRA